MYSLFAESLRPHISEIRLEAYRPSNGDDLAMMAMYLHNVALSEALFTPLGFLEITLRNSLHKSLSELFGTPAWLELPGVLLDNDARSVATVRRRIEGEGKAVTPDRIVSELNFGFWVALLSGGYDSRFWRLNKSRSLKTAFPNIPKRFRQRPVIYKRYNELRSLRNRVFHHEAIWNRVTLDSDYIKIYEAIRWISSEVETVCKLVDRFEFVHQQGYHQAAAAIANLVAE